MVCYSEFYFILIGVYRKEVSIVLEKAIYSLFNPISLYSLKINGDKYIKYGACTAACKLNVDVLNDPNSLECIRCEECIDACPKGAIKSGFRLEEKKDKKMRKEKI